MEDRRSFLRLSALLSGSRFMNPQNILAGFARQPGWKIKPLRNDVSVFTEQDGTIGFLVTKSAS